MPLFKSIAALSIICLFQNVGAAQDITSSRATVILDKTTVKANAPIKIHVHLDKAPSFAGTVWITFTPPPNSNGAALQLTPYFKAGEQDADFEQTIPPDAAGGEYELAGVYFRVSRNYPLKFDRITLNIEAFENPIVPTSASVALDHTEKIFLETNATALKKILSDLTDSLHRNAADTPELRNALRTSTSNADTVFKNAIASYGKLKEKSLSSPPIFLEDFHLHFRNAYEGLTSSSKVANDGIGGPFLIRVRDEPTVYSHDYPVLALGVIDLLQKGIKAFEISDTNNSYYFEVAVISRPSDAKVYYTRLDHPYELAPSNTDIPKLTLQYAFWTFLFDKNDCTDIEDLDPYNVPVLTLTGKLKCNGTKK
jgi:hypothetical protein